MKVEDIEPGRVVLLDGIPHLIETTDVAITVVLQRIDRAYTMSYDEPHRPVFMKLSGAPDDAMFNEPYMTLLVPQGETDDSR